MARHSISRFLIIVAVVAGYSLSFHGTCASGEAKAESKAPATDPLTNRAIRVDLIQRDSPLSPLLEGRNLSMAERLRRAVERSHKRLSRLQHYNAFQNAQLGNYYSPVNYVEGGYFMQMAIGSPVPLNLHFIVDTGSDLVWTQCEPCSNRSCEAQDDPMFDPSQSSSYTNVSCSNHFCSDLTINGGCNSLNNCLYSYGYESGGTSGVLAEETFSLPSVGSSEWTFFPNLTFGCGGSQYGDFLNSSGIIGLGRGPLSLVSQIGSSIGNIFSYCLGSIYNASQTSPLFLGSSATVGTGFSVTPLIQNNWYFQSSFYYLGLDGISVAGQPVPIPEGTFAIQADGSGGLIIDSGSTFTSLVEPGYKPFLEAVRSTISAEPVINASATTGFDLCYNSTLPAIHYPTIIFHFAEGAEYVLPPEKSFISDMQDTGGLVCLAFNSSGYGISIFGNFQQQNFHIVYDLGYNRLSFAPTNCASL